jgi:hypothetical protein
MGGGYARERVHVRRMAVKVYRNDPGGAAGAQLALRRVDRDGARERVAVDQHGHGTHQAHRFGRRDERIRRHDHAIARPGTQRAKREHQRVGPGGDRDAVPRLARGGELLLELRHFRPAYERARAQDATPGAEDLVVQRRVLLGQVEQRHPRPGSEEGHPTPTIGRSGTGAQPLASDT